MTELALLERRRELVQLSARLQRATLARRLDALEAHPARALLDLVLASLRRTATPRAAIMAVLGAWRALRRKKH